MAATEPRTNHQSRVDWWRGQFQRQRRATLSVTDFCRQLGVSVTTFYYWKRRVQAGLRIPSEPISAASPSRKPIPAAAPFVPVLIVNPDADTHLEIELANACIVRLRSALSPRLLRAAIQTAGSLGGSRPGAGPARSVDAPRPSTVSHPACSGECSAGGKFPPSPVMPAPVSQTLLPKWFCTLRSDTPPRFQGLPVAL